MVMTPQGDIAAANRATLALFGTETIQHVRGRSLVEFVAEADRVRVSEFVNQVHDGASMSIRFELVSTGPERRTVETRAVRLRRDDTDVLLGVMWEVPARQANEDDQPDTEDLRGRCEAAESALREATTACADLSRRNDELTASLFEVQGHRDLQVAEQRVIVQRLQGEIAALSAARTSDQHASAEACTQRNAERDQLQARIADLEAQLTAAETALREADIARIEQSRHNDELTASLFQAQGRLDLQVAEQRITVKRLQGEIATLSSARTSDQEAYEDARRQWAAERDAWQARVVDLDAQLMTAQSALREANTALTQQSRRNDELTASLSETQTVLQTERASIEQLRSDIATLSAARTSDQEAYAEVCTQRNAERDQLQARIADLETQLTAAETALRAATAARAEQARHNRQILEQCDVQRDGLKARIVTLEAQLTELRHTSHETLERAIQAEQARYQELLIEEQRRWRGELTNTWHSLKHGVEDLLNDRREVPEAAPAVSADATNAMPGCEF